ncbi:hypothetical protein P167DRAFT_219520 [Morchella conica CCBAS932]|uniref:Uncharacterized protein n=1 Tax=Morchella conica CCBAS932 TaxID=1392247 RepID=A0A3N4KL64_9PEZI|nr:hypothetical protein P167DRAFT_219520 [Morchella conica CCBAS932]
MWVAEQSRGGKLLLKPDLTLACVDTNINRRGRHVRKEMREQEKDGRRTSRRSLGKEHSGRTDPAGPAPPPPPPPLSGFDPSLLPSFLYLTLDSIFSPCWLGLGVGLGLYC